MGRHDASRVQWPDHVDADDASTTLQGGVDRVGPEAG